jgi:hypothetical protein
MHARTKLTVPSGLYRVFIVQAYQTSQYVMPRGGIFLGKWRSSFAENSSGKMDVQSACALNTRALLRLGEIGWDTQTGGVRGSAVG